ncbi:UNVERIFIED_CONTAM: hypothetical protein PYX00_002393 [Menopon gallinae]|uniref:G-protein coupled receptors family 1 profile domain-containing protein n=1 Tax=Menopon gallinae TaxID=328185 RepID=A0AAW2IGR4_9NEOP
MLSELLPDATTSDPANGTEAVFDGELPNTFTYYNSGFGYNGSFENGTDSDVWDKFILPWWRQLLWSILFATMIIVSTGGNLIVIWIVLTNKRMRTVTNYFLVNLSIADIMVSTLNVTFNYTYMLNSDWPFGYLYCKINPFIAVITICASVFTLMAISIDRYMAIMNPLRPRMGRKMTLGIAVGIWIVGIFFSIPNLIFHTLEVVTYKEGRQRRVCFMVWPDGPSTESEQEYWYNVFFLLLTYVLPIGSMTFTYTKIGLELWVSKSIGECTQRQLENIKSKRRVVKMMIVVVFIFMLCWLPFQIYFILTSHFPELVHSSYIQEVYLAIYWLAMSNAMYNPIIYCWMNSRFRRGFKEFFSWCPGVEVGPALLARRDPVTARYSVSGSPEGACRIVRNGSYINTFLYTIP